MVLSLAQAAPTRKMWRDVWDRGPRRGRYGIWRSYGQARDSEFRGQTVPGCLHLATPFQYISWRAFITRVPCPPFARPTLAATTLPITLHINDIFRMKIVGPLTFLNTNNINYLRRKAEVIIYRRRTNAVFVIASRSRRRITVNSSADRYAPDKIK